MKKKILLVISLLLIGLLSLYFYIKTSMGNKSGFAESKLSNYSEDLIVSIDDKTTIELVLIKDGSFKMGSIEETGDEDELPVRDIKISDSFYMGTFEVTQRQWEAVMGYNPSKFVGTELPVDSVSFYECLLFTEKVSEITGLLFSLPTEAMWEYACRAGTTTKWFYGDIEGEEEKYSWISPHDDNKTHKVGEKNSNQWGLYDMYGNVQEWCLDWYENPYSLKESIDPIGPKKGASRVVRGGGWGAFADNARSAYRNALGPNIKSDGVGFRCVIINK